MKIFLFLFCVLGLFPKLFSQTCLSVTTDQTTSIVFAFPIVHVDRGSPDILVQEMKGSENTLLIKAASRHFHPTNLTILTSDGSLYSFPVAYDSLPSTLIYKIPAQLKSSVETYANTIIDNRRFIHGINDISGQIHFAVTGIYIKDGVVYYQLRLRNESPIDYDVDFLRFYIRDKKRIRRTASQEIELKPVYVAGNHQQVKANESTLFVIAFEKFTLPDAKFFAIEIGEKNGGRNLLLKVKNNKILKAIGLPDVK